jgi:protein-disulfide isomerase
MLETNVIEWAKGRLKAVTIVLALLAIGIEIYYSICEGVCSYLRGELFGIDLQYIGIAFMALIVLLSVMKQSLLLILALSAGVGVEVYLVGFQIFHNTYCPYCLAFGGILVVMFFLNIRKTEAKSVILCAAISLVLFALFFRGSATPAYASETVTPSFGSGKISVRLYTDYFCPPCRAMEPRIEPLLSELLKKNIINLTFVDTPIYKPSPLYARYFLYILNEKKDLETALHARSVLIGAAVENISDQVKLEEYLKNSGIKVKPFDPKPVFDILSNYLKNDKISSTPTCVVEQGGKTDKYTGGQDIVSALERLKQESQKRLP